MKPRDGREMALKFLFSVEFKTETDPSELAFKEELLSKLIFFKNSFKASDQVWAFVTRLIKTFEINHAEIDAKIQDQIQNWKIERLSFTDKNILRIAVTEMVYMDLNPKIAINEAIELGKKYSSQESKSFLNGVLDQIRKEEER